MELSDLESEEEEPEERQRRIEQLAAGLAQDSSVVVQTRRAPVNMDIDTLSERSEEEGEAGEEREPRRQRKQSGRRRSRSREQSVAKIRSGIRINSQLTRVLQVLLAVPPRRPRELAVQGGGGAVCPPLCAALTVQVQPGGWCPRCLETSHWEDQVSPAPCTVSHTSVLQCWVSPTQMLCSICSVPGHLPCIHHTGDFRQRKLVIDTFGWLPFKDWFQVCIDYSVLGYSAQCASAGQDLTFRSWWNCSGYTGVPLYKIMQRTPHQDLDLGFQEQQHQ